MAREDDAVEFQGTIEELLSNARFLVKLDNDHRVIAYTAGRMRKNRIRVLKGDRVTVAVTPYDPKRGRIVYRER